MAGFQIYSATGDGRICLLIGNSHEGEKDDFKLLLTKMGKAIGRRHLRGKIGDSAWMYHHL